MSNKFKKISPSPPSPSFKIYDENKFNQKTLNTTFQIIYDILWRRNTPLGSSLELADTPTQKVRLCDQPTNSQGKVLEMLSHLKMCSSKLCLIYRKHLNGWSPFMVGWLFICFACFCRCWFHSGVELKDLTGQTPAILVLGLGNGQ